MHTWPVQDAKARFSEFLDACVANGPQVVTRRGAEMAIFVPIAQWKRFRVLDWPCMHGEPHFLIGYIL